MNNIPEFSVTEFSNLAKNILEENFSLVKIKGEISSVKNFKGHLYFSIKDENYVLKLTIVKQFKNKAWINHPSKSLGGGYP